MADLRDLPVAFDLGILPQTHVGETETSRGEHGCGFHAHETGVYASFAVVLDMLFRCFAVSSRVVELHRGSHGDAVAEGGFVYCDGIVCSGHLMPLSDTGTKALFL